MANEETEIENAIVDAYQHLSPNGRREAWKRLMANIPEETDTTSQKQKETTVKQRVPLKQEDVSTGKQEPVARVLFSTPSHQQRISKVSSPITGTATMLHKMPKLPPFSGVKGKDSSFGRWRYEIKCLQHGPHEDYTILDAMHASLKSPAADLLVTMGADATVDGILRKFTSRYGTVLPADILTEKFYSTKQGEEDCAGWAFLLEDLIYQVEEKGAITHEAVPRMLKSRFWRGLKEKHIQEATRHTWEGMDFDEYISEHAYQYLVNRYNLQKQICVINTV
jgi:hypothetical protein